MIRFNPNTSAQLLRLGDSGSDAVQLDDAALNWQQIQQACAGLTFAPDTASYYPGLRAAMPQPYALAVLEAVYPLLQQLLQPPAHFRLRTRQLFFSLVTTDPSALQPAQCLPHFDTPSPYHAAILHHLSAGPHGGTAFYRHQASGICRLTPANQAGYFDALNQQLARQPLPAQYPTVNCPGFDLVAAIPHQQNRLVIYPGSLLHSALIDPATDLSANPLHGRLTANLFVEFTAD